MKFRWRTIGGLLIVAVVAAGTAVVFQRPASRDAAAIDPIPVGQVASSGRGRIVPLVVNDDALPAAFVAPAPSQSHDAIESPSRLQSLPTIRASLASEEGAQPQLAHDFPRPLPLAHEGIDLREPAEAPVSAGAAQFAPIARPIVAAKPPIPAAPVRHVIVDGDTLPQLAERYLGDASLAEEIFAENRDTLASPELLPLGATIVITRAQ